MTDLSNIAVTKITAAYTVKFEKTTQTKVVRRKCCGITLAFSGKIVYKHNGKKYVSDPEHLILLPMGESYELECIQSGEFSLINFRTTENFKLSEFVRLKTSSSKEFFSMHLMLEEMMRHRERFCNAEMFAELYKILTLVVKEQNNNGIAPNVKKAIMYIDNNLTSNLSVKEVAKYVGISEEYLRKIFYSNTNLSPKQYIQMSKMGMAKNRLISTSDSITDISEQCGYSSLYHFCRAFKAYNRCTPGDYRKTNRII